MNKEIMVKVCPKCGIVNAEKAEDCESCGAELDAPVTNKAANKLSRQITRRNEKLKKAIAAEKFSAPEETPVNIPVTTAHIVIGVIGCFTAVCVVVFMALCSRFFPGFEYEMTLAAFGVLILLASAILHSFLPEKMWMIDHFFDQIHYKEMPKPSDTGIKLQMFGCVLLILIGIAFITLQLLVISGVL